jgi:alkaline phosphatase D
VRFLWSGDTCGQGYGINPDIGGMRIYDTMRRLKPDFFIHSGDTIYADNPIPPQIQLPDGQVWKNIVSEAKSKVAETLDEFRGNYRYNLLDAHLRAFHASVPVFYQWDDHEVINNWYPQEILNDPRYTETRVAVLAERSRQAFLEYTPIPESRDESGRIYRKIPYGPLLDVFMLDMRTYRGPNGPNRQESSSSDTALLGPQQLTWLKKELAESRAAWKVIASDMPLGLIVYDDYVKKTPLKTVPTETAPL